MIRPSLSMLGVGTGLASFTSSSTVFSMSAVNLLSRRVWRLEINVRRVVFMAAGSVAGAFAGAYALNYIGDRMISIGFILVLLGISILTGCKRKIKPLGLDSALLQWGVGGGTGFLSGLFGIGGGPFQMGALLLLFGLNPKEAALQSIFITMLTSAASVIQYGLNGFMDFSICLYTIPGGIIGGLLGGVVSKHIKQSHVSALFILMISLAAFSQLYMLFKGA